MAQIKGDQVSEGYQEVDILTMKDIYYNKINQDELKRIHKLEWIDEYEEFDLMMSHYFVSIAKKTKNDDSAIKKVKFENLADQN